MQLNPKLINYPKSETAGYHNSIFRGKNISKYYEDGSLYTRISSGKFTDLFVGDYIIKNDITWRIAGFDVYLHKGDTSMTKHHAIIVPDTNLTNASMNTTNTTNGGYVGSNMYTAILPSVLNTYIMPVFGNHVLEYRNLLTNSVNATGYNRLGTNSGCASEWNWYTRKLDLLNEIQLFGSIVWSSSARDIGSDNCQLPLFRLVPELNINKSFWLRNIATISNFSLVGSDGRSDSYDASISSGVRPYFYID